MKKAKHVLCIVVCMSLLLSCLSFPSQAADGSAVSVFSCIEGAAGSVISFFARLFNKLTKTDEADIPSAPEQSPSWQEYSGGVLVSDPEQVLSAETWVAVEISYESEKTYADPFNDVDVELLLCGNGRLYTVPGFWDGGNTWKVRFVCPSAGEWYFKTVCTDTENNSLHNRTGKVACSEYSGEYDIYKHGFVTTLAGEKYFTYDDGTPFFYLGDTHWSLGDETVAQNTNTKFNGGIKTGTVGSLLPDTAYTYCWFDPITGEYSEEKEFVSNALGAHFIGERPKATDMVLLIRKAN